MGAAQSKKGGLSISMIRVFIFFLSEDAQYFFSNNVILGIPWHFTMHTVAKCQGALLVVAGRREWPRASG
jgi:hypothetical protein